MTDDVLDLAARAARTAGDLLRARFGDPRTGVGTKSSGTDMVTDADRESERLIVDALRGARPDDAILGEELGEAAGGGTSGVRWIVDPLDGTTNFLYGIPHVSVSIACEDDHGALAGVVYDVMRDELFAAARGKGATMNGEPIRVSDEADVARALVGTGFSYKPEERAIQAELTTHLLPNVRDIRRNGSAALDLAWTACGRFDGFFEAQLAPWDRAAGELLVREAGGSVALIEGIVPSGPGVVAGGPGVFDGLRALVERAIGSQRAPGAD